MEALVNSSALEAFYRGRRILVTGHTGFKGSWLCLWLHTIGAEVFGFALPPEKNPDSLYSLARVRHAARAHQGDIRNFSMLRRFVANHKPEIIFHMAAQSLVLPSYESPLDTCGTNIMGTLNVLEAARQAGGVKAIVNVTTDKCYENNEQAVHFRETDRLGGHDPYSSSKAAAEIVSAAYRDSFLAREGIYMATARAGNVIGGGDFSRHRLVPDIIRSMLDDGEVKLRHPDSIRPWQYVLDVLHGYMLLGQALYEKGGQFADAFNFGPEDSNITVSELTNRLITAVGIHLPVTSGEVGGPEAQTLMLDSSKARKALDWAPLCTAREAIDDTAAWYRCYLDLPRDIAAFTHEQINSYREKI